MEAPSTVEPRRPRARREEAPETGEQPVSEPVEAPAEGAAGEPLDGPPPPAQEAEKPAEKKRRERKPDTIEVDVSALNWMVKLSVFLPAPIIWKLKHVIADMPGKSERDVIESLLTEWLKGFDYPRQPDWLLALIQRQKEVDAARRVSAN